MRESAPIDRSSAVAKGPHIIETLAAAPAMAPTRIPAILITGATGAGKTSLISRLLCQRPAAERWAVLVNDFGRGHLAVGEADENVVVREVAGCICCTGQVSLRTALVSMLRAAHPHRLLIEASGAAEPAAVIRVLNEPGLSKAVELESTVCAVGAEHLADSRYAATDVYRAQLCAADVIVLRLDEPATEGPYAKALARIAKIRSTPVRVVNAADPSEPLDVLEVL